MVGEPHFLSSTTLRPFGPRVTLTALATALAPRSSARRASSSNFNCLAAMEFSLVVNDIYVLHGEMANSNRPSLGRYNHMKNRMLSLRRRRSDLHPAEPDPHLL